MASKLASVVLPVYNQADHIREVVIEHLEHLQKLPCPVELLLVVNGHQRDRSRDICLDLEHELAPVRTLVSEAGGWGLAVNLGLSEAKGDLLCYTNSARTAPHELLLLLMYGQVHPEAVIKANRKIRDSLFRRLGSLLYNLECRMLFDLPYWDINGTPKVFPRSMTPFLRLTSTDDLVDLEFHIVCKREGYAVLEIPIISTVRHGGRSSTNIGSALRLYTGAFRLRRLARER